MFTAVLLLLLGLYAAVAAATATAARRASGDLPSQSTTEDELPSISVIIAARNEQEALPACLRALQAQSYPSDRYEIIVADDGSSDRTRAVAAEHEVRCVRVPEEQGGKAAAIHAAAATAVGEVVAVTDADCRPPSPWLGRVAAVFRDDGVGMVCGVTTVAGSALLSRVQAMDWTLLLTVSAGLSALGFPLSAMGNNMAFRRQAYDTVGGYPALEPSVTEDYALFRAIDRRTPWGVKLILNGGLTNVTLPLPSLREVLRQRKRWARGGLSADPWIYLFYALVYAVHASIVVGLFVGPAWAIAGLCVKMAADAAVLHVGGRGLGQRHIRPSFFAFQLYLFAYVLALPVMLAAFPTVEWRGRKW